MKKSLGVSSVISSPRGAQLGKPSFGPRDIEARRWRGAVFGDGRAGDQYRSGGRLLVLLILAMLVIDVIRGGSDRLSWGFPQQGAVGRHGTAGGVFPAIFGQPSRWSS